MVFALIIALSGIASGTYLLILDKPITGLVALFTPLGIIVAAFIYDKKIDVQNKDDRED